MNQKPAPPHRALAKPRTPFPVRLAAALIAAVALPAVAPCTGAIARADIGDAMIPLVIRGDDAAQRYRDALRRIEAGELQDGIRRLQSLHEEIWGRNLMTRDPALANETEGWIVAVSLTGRIVESIRTLSPEGIEFYRSEFALPARTLLERGLARRDPESLVRTSELYPITDTTRAALLAAGDLFFEQDLTARAGEVWMRLASFVGPGDAHETPVAVRLALLASRGHDDAALLAANERLGRLGVGLTVPTVPSTDDSHERVSLPFEHGMLAWRTYSYSRKNQTRSMEYPRHRAIDYVQVPGVGQGWVAVATTREMLRFDVDTGKQVGQVRFPYESRYFEEDPMVRYYAVPDGDLLVANYVTAATDPSEYLGFDITVAVPQRALQGIRVGTDRPLWDTHRLQNADPFLAELSFNSTPVVEGGRVYALGWRKKGYIDVFLVCLDARTGERVWIAPLVGNQVELTMFGEQAREPMLGEILLDDGTVYCSTNLGVICRVRASDGHVLWATEYETTLRRSYRGRGRGRSFPQDPNWRRNPVLLARDRLFATPLDSGELLVLDPEDGRIVQMEGTLSGFMVGVLGDHIVFADRDIHLVPVRDVERGAVLSSRMDSSVRGRPALVENGIVYANSNGLFHQELRGVRTALPGAVKLCDNWIPDDDAGRPHRGSDVLDGHVTVLHDRILVTSSHWMSCYIEEPDPLEVRPR